MEMKIPRSWFKEGVKYLHGLAYWLYEQSYKTHLKKLETEEYLKARDEALKRVLKVIVFSKYVIVVAIQGAGEDWTAYAKGVRGHNREDDIYDAYRNGDKIYWEEAKLLFPDIKLEWRR